MNFLLRFMENCHTFCHTRDLYFIAYRCIWLYVGTFATNEKSPETRGFDDVFVSCWISLVVVVQIGAGGGGENRTIQWLSGVNVADLYKTIKKTIIKLPLGRYPWILFLCFVFFYFDTFSNPGEKSPQLPANPAVFFKFNKLACGDFPKKPCK